MTTDPYRLAIVGGGALTESVYLPILKESKVFNVCCIVDNNETQAKRLTQLYNIPSVFHDYHDLDKIDIDAALIVLPNFLHAPVAIYLLEKGIHVLVEKPMANTLEQCLAILESAKLKRARLAVGLVRRFYPTTVFLKELIHSKAFGKLVSFNFEEGHVFEWKLQSDYLLVKEKAGGGVLVDTGVHMLDQMIYCMGVPLELEYFDDNQGGVEADCKLSLKMKDGTNGVIRFSRIRKLRNTMRFKFEHAEVEAGLNANSEVKITINGVSNIINAQIMNKSNGIVFRNRDAFEAQLNDFASAIRNNTDCKVDGNEGLLSVKLIEQCYSSRKSIYDVENSF